MTDGALTGIELRSLITEAGELTLSLADVTLAPPGPDELIVRVEAAPINPSDLGLLLGPADLDTMTAGGTAARPTVTFAVPPQRLGSVQARLGQSMAVGNEGAGTVIQAGADHQHLVGRKVGMLGGAMYATHRRIAARDVIVLPEDATAADGASMFINPLTALAMTDVMRREGHTALVHTAAASNLGQMLNRICQADGIALVNIVRSTDQAKILTDAGAAYVVDSSTPEFGATLTDVLAETGATIAFDAIGGGKLANAILHAMERAALRTMTDYSRYGSSTPKQVYIYGSLDTGPTVIDRGFGFAWSVSGFLLTPYLQALGAAGVQAMRERVARELKTTFASHYTDRISLAQTLDPDILAAYQRKATGRKYLIDPSL